ncbi:MAG: GYD domain-containing protein [Thermodesulfobacteriota bacterium]
MAKYIMMSVLTDEGRKTMKMRPERIQEVNKEMEKMGVKVITQYAVIGPYDFINIVEAPDNETITKVSTELGARGTVQIMTLAAIPISDFEKQLTGKSKKKSKKK